MDACSVAQDFLACLDAEKGYSPKTQLAYASDLSQFLEFVRSEGVAVPEGVSVALVRRWIVSMKQRGLAASTIARHVYALRSFWRFLQDSDLVDHDPLSRISVPKRRQLLPTRLSVEEARHLLAAGADHRDPVVAARDFAMMATLVFTGVRRSELLALRLEDVMLPSRTLHVRCGKGGKGRMIPLVEEVVDAIGTWLAVRPAAAHDYLFTTVCGNRIYPSRLQIIWQRVRKQSGVTREGVSLHTLRHTFATLLLKGGADLVAIQGLLGHSRLETTAVYLHADTRDLRSGVERHPLAGTGVATDPAKHTEAPAPRPAPAWRRLPTQSR
ncbi:tyrosine-type recombinase/integrase [bacterium]|nr:tyrosine-type recombinase/integrase [bacterium]